MNLNFTRVIYNTFLVGFIAVLLASCGGSRKSSTTKPASGNTKSKGYLTDIELQKKYAQLVDVSITQISNLKLYRFIEEWMGAPYKIGGMSKSGVDCSAFAFNLYKAIYDYSLPRTSMDQYKAIKQFRRRKHLKEGDLLFFATSGGRRISHVGIYLDNDRFINATTSRGVMVCNLNDTYWDNAYIDGGGIWK
ncbi:C40 family peptidase [Polluticaenibacter yanchengensis]|uniref:NlpC/P60 family protein n=1 Tax=Polluticaenibacter yanchengensis TaxID=3014562 RepID=A0ABT4UHI0_9BACT|nr:NlpC/P60 family protein [Chitinophagaceae bacterium LY-5]